MLNFRLMGLEAAIFALVLITTLVVNGNVQYFDTYYGSIIHEMRGPGLNTFMEMITYIGNWQTVTVLCLALLAFDKTRKTYGIPVTTVAILSTVLNKIFKMIIERPRPDAAGMLIEQSGFSYPSGHATTAAAVAIFLGYLLYKNMNNKKLASLYVILLLILSFAIAFSRVYLGVHYSSDVMAGWILGGGCFCVASMYFYPYKKEKQKKIEEMRAKRKAKINELEEIKAEVVDEEIESNRGEI